VAIGVERLTQQARKAAVGERTTVGLAVLAVDDLVRLIRDTQKRLAAARTRLARPVVDREAQAELGFRQSAGASSFLLEGAHAHDLATLLDLEGVAVRSGHHCAHPLMQFYGVAATCRASFAFYNTHDEIERFIAALLKARKLLA